MNNKGKLYFAHDCFFLCVNGRSQVLRTSSHDQTEPEEIERRAWFNLGLGIEEALNYKIEFLALYSYHKVIDQLNTVHVDDPICDRMRDEVLNKGLKRFIDFTTHKISLELFNEHVWEGEIDLKG
jgi:hypothetical protein